MPPKVKTTLDYVEESGIEAFSTIPERISPNGAGVKIVLSEKAGRGMIAAQDFGSRELLFAITRPMFVAVGMTSGRITLTCDNCLVHKCEEYGVATIKGKVKLSVCSGCRVLCYCSTVGFHASTNSCDIY